MKIIKSFFLEKTNKVLPVEHQRKNDDTYEELLSFGESNNEKLVEVLIKLDDKGRQILRDLENCSFTFNRTEIESFLKGIQMAFEGCKQVADVIDPFQISPENRTLTLLNQWAKIRVLENVMFSLFKLYKNLTYINETAEKKGWVSKKISILRNTILLNLKKLIEQNLKLEFS